MKKHKPKKFRLPNKKELESRCASLIQCIKNPGAAYAYESDDKYYGSSVFINDKIEYIDFDPYKIEDEDYDEYGINLIEFYNSDFYKKAFREWQRSDPVCIAINKARASILNAIRKRGFVKDKRTVEVLGCSGEYFAKYLESMFEDWMNWDNYGGMKVTKFDFNKTWDLDHIIPISTAKTIEDVYRLNHYTNLQPMCSAKNRFHKKNNLN